jgi:hypothetical protein
MQNQVFFWVAHWEGGVQEASLIAIGANPLTTNTNEPATATTTIWTGN